MIAAYNRSNVIEEKKRKENTNLSCSVFTSFLPNSYGTPAQKSIKNLHEQACFGVGDFHTYYHCIHY